MLQKERIFMEITIYNGGIQINVIRNNGAVNQGKNVANSWQYYAKANYCIGQVAGNLNIIPVANNFLNDTDLIDADFHNAAAFSPVGGSIIERIE